MPLLFEGSCPHPTYVEGCAVCEELTEFDFADLVADLPDPEVDQ